MNRDLLEAELRRDEGVKYYPYIDTRGFRTIGVGYNMDANPLPAGWTFPLTDAQVDTLLSAKIDAIVFSLNKYLPWWTGMSDVRQRVLMNMAYNMGISGLLEFKNTLHDMSMGNYTGAAAGMSASEWAGQVGNRATRLIKSMDTGVMQNEPA